MNLHLTKWYLILAYVLSFGCVFSTPAQAVTYGSDYYISGRLRVGSGSSDSGNNSLAIGQGSTASGNNSVCLAPNSTSSGAYAMAIGINSTASGWYSSAIGIYSNASGNYSIALGPYASASGLNALAVGFGSAANQTNSTALGFNSTVSSTGQAAVAIGGNASASGIASVSIGLYSQATGNYSLALGYYSNATADNSIALSGNTTTPSYASMVIGRFNYVRSGQSLTSWVGTDDLFVAGNGTSSTSLSNAFEIAKNGNIGIGNLTTAPAEALELIGHLRLDQATPGSPVNGTLVWNGTNLELRQSGNWTVLGANTSFSGSFQLAANGNATSPTLSFGGGNNTGVFSPSANVFSLATDSAEQLRVDSSGNIGIDTGNATLSNRLTENGTASFNTSGGGPILTVDSSGNLTISSNTTFNGTTQLTFGNQTTVVLGQAQGDILMGDFQ